MPFVDLLWKIHRVFFGKGMDFCTHGSRSFPCLPGMKSSLVYFLRLSGASSSRTSGGSLFSASFSGSAPSSVSASEVDMLFGSTAGSSSSIGSLELSASLCFFFFFFFFGDLKISSLALENLARSSLDAPLDREVPGCVFHTGSLYNKPVSCLVFHC